MTPTLTEPTPEALRAALHGEAGAPLTYEEVGHTWLAHPGGFTVDDQDVVIGHGRADFLRATALLRAWTQFDLPWIRALDRSVPLVEGAMFAFASHQLGVWATNVCRIVRVVEQEDAAGAVLGFAYGTVGTHALRGEERFLLRWDARTEAVTFGIRKFSLPSGLLFTLLAPLARSVQTRFTRDALARLAAGMPS